MFKEWILGLVTHLAKWAVDGHNPLQIDFQFARYGPAELLAFIARESTWDTYVGLGVGDPTLSLCTSTSTER